MKWMLILSYLLSALLVTGCTSSVQSPQLVPAPSQQVLTMALDPIQEHPLTTQVRELNWQLLQQPFFVQGAFEHGQRLYITYPSSVVALPITHEELQRASAETLTQPRWFDIQVLAVAEQDQSAEMVEKSYSLVISVVNVKDTPNAHTLTIELLNNRFNTVEAHVSRVILL
jgi:hypothetical protein